MWLKQIFNNVHDNTEFQLKLSHVLVEHEIESMPI